MSINGDIDECSTTYKASRGIGVGVGIIALGGASVTRVAQIAKVKTGAQATLLSLQLLTGGGDVATYVTEGVPLQEQLAAIIDTQQEAAAEEGLSLTR